MTTSSETTSHILELISTWRLEEARQEYAKSEAELADADRITISALLSEREKLAGDFQAATQLIPNQPQEALNRLQKLPRTIESHPEHASGLKRAEGAALEARRQEALRLCAEAQDLADARRWQDAEIRLAQAESAFSNWASDPDLATKMQLASSQVQRAQLAEARLLALDRALQDSDWTQAGILLRSLEDLGNVPDDQLRPKREELEKLRTRAGGKSATREYDTKIENLQAVKRSLEKSQNWRARYNNAVSLVQEYRAANLEAEAPLASADADLYMQNLVRSVRETIDERLQSAQAALKNGQLPKARGLVEAAERAGNAPEPRPGEPVDRAGPIALEPAENQKIAQLLQEIEEKEKAREDAKIKVQDALRLLGQHTLDGLKEARANLALARNLDASYPGLGELEQSLRDEISRLIGDSRQVLYRQMQQALELRGDVEAARKTLVDMVALGLEASDLSSYQTLIDRVEARRQVADQERAAFQALFAHVQDTLDCIQAAQLKDRLEKWRQQAFDLSGPDMAQRLLDAFLAECPQLSADRLDVHNAVQIGRDLVKQVPAAERLASSRVGNRPVVAELLAGFWQAMAQYHGEHDADINYLRKAQRFAERTGDEQLQSQIAGQIAQALSRTAEGKRLANIITRLDECLQSDLQGGLDLIASLAATDPARSDPTISALISDINRRVARQRAKALFTQAQQSYTGGDLQGAHKTLEGSLREAVTLEAQVLQLEIGHKLDWEKRKESVLDAALSVGVTASSRSLSLAERYALGAGKAAAEEIRQQQASIELDSKAGLALSAYSQWQTSVETSVTQLEQEITDRIDQLEFTEAENAIKQVEQSGVPDGLIPKLIGLRQKTQEARRQAERVRNRITEAKSLAAWGKFNEAMRMVNRGSPFTKLNEECRTLTERWTKDVNDYAHLMNNLPALPQDVERALSPVTEPQEVTEEGVEKDSPPKTLSALLRDLAEHVGIAQQLELDLAEPHRQAYESMQKIALWLQQVMQLADEGSVAQTELEQRHSQWDAYAADGLRLSQTLPTKVVALTVSLGQRLAWLKERQRALDVFLDTVKAIPKAGRFRKSLRSPLSEQRKVLDQVKNLTRAEERSREVLGKALKEAENRQIWASIVVLIAPILLLACARVSVPIINVVVRPVPTNTPVVVTATPLPTRPPTITPTPTVTPTPTATPVTIAQCIAKWQQWVFNEAGADPDNPANHAGYMLQGESVGILRDVPTNPALRNDWIKVLIKRKDAETKGWIRREWIDCP